MSARDRRRSAPAGSKPRYTKEELLAHEKEWGALVKFHASPLVQFLLPLNPNPDALLLHFQIRWLDSKNPYYVWRAIHECTRRKREFDSWIVKYLAGCALRMLSENSKHAKDVRKILPWVLDFHNRKRGPGDYPLKPDGDEYIWMALAEYFAAEIEKGATPVEARQGAKQKCLEYRFKMNPADIRVDGNPVSANEAKRLAADVKLFAKRQADDVHKKLDHADDKTLRTNIEKCFGVKKSLRTNAEWKQALAAWNAEAAQWLGAQFRETPPLT